MTIIRLRLFPVQQDERSSLLMIHCLKHLLKAFGKMFSRFVELYSKMIMKKIMMNQDEMELEKKNKLQLSIDHQQIN